jgi:signal transduction histidine kinase
MTPYATDMGRWRTSERAVELALSTAVTLVAMVGVGTELAYAPQPHPVAAGAYVITLAAGALLLWRRHHPVRVALAVLVLLAGYHGAGYHGFAPALVMFVAVYSVAAYGRPPNSLIWCAILLAGIWLIPTLPVNPVPWWSLAILGPILGLGWMVVIGLAARQRRLGEADRIRRAAGTAEAEAGRRIAEERLRIARELHDVLAHTISVISVQAGTALDHLDTDPARTRIALQHVRTAAKQAMPELRAAVGPLRSGGIAAPQPRLDQLADLVETARRAGVAATLHCTAGELPPHTELTVYRIVQESLTNVVRHAHASTVEVSVMATPDEVLVEVRDDGAGGAAAPPGGESVGFGILGMRERAIQAGGTLDAGATGDGGFRVLARLPQRFPELS